MRDEKAYTRIRRARTALILKHPFFASLVMRLKMREDFDCRTAWTDGSLFAYNPHYINMLSPEKLVGLAAHIVMHPACSHHKRKGARDALLWNRACDYVINPILLDAGFTLPDGYLYDEDLGERSVEAVYDFIAAGDVEEDVEGTSEAQGEEEESAGSNEEEEQQGDSGAGGDEENDDEDSLREHGDPGLAGEVRDELEGAGEGEESEGQPDWEEAIVHAAIQARDCGDIPSGLERFLEQMLSPRLSWRELLARFIASSARSDYSWQHPNSRYLHLGLYFPSLKNCELEEIVVALDTSGSINREDLEQFVAEISDIIALRPTRLHLLYCDLKITGVEVFERCELPVEIQPVGGGGTDFRPVFNYIEEGGFSPACLIYLSDLECLGYPKEEPGYPVLWVKVGNSSRTPPFGETINLISGG